MFDLLMLAANGIFGLINYRFYVLTSNPVHLLIAGINTVAFVLTSLAMFDKISER